MAYKIHLLSNNLFGILLYGSTLNFTVFLISHNECNCGVGPAYPRQSDLETAMAHTCKIETGGQNVRLRQLVYEPRTWLALREKGEIFSTKIRSSSSRCQSHKRQLADELEVCSVKFQ